MKKLLAVCLAILLPMVSLSGIACAESAPEPVTLEFWSNNLLPTFQDYLQGLVDAYQAENPHVTINWQDIPQNALQEKLTTAIASNTAPDVVDVGATILGVMASKGALTKLNEEAPAELIDQYVPGILASDTIGGSLYGFPWYATPYVTLYNKELFDKAGISVPKNYEELFTGFKTMKDAAGAWLMVPTKVSHILYFNGITLLSEDRKSAAFNTPEAAALLNKFVDGVKEGYIYETDWNGWDANLQVYATGQLAMLNSGAQSIRRIKDEAPNVYALTEVAPPIVGSNGFANSQVESLVVPVTSKHHEEAIKFAAWVASAKNQVEFSKLVAVFPTTKDGVADPFFTSDTETLEGKALAMITESINISMQVALPINQSSAVLKEIDALYGRIFADGMSVEEALTETEANVNTMLLDEPQE